MFKNEKAQEPDKLVFDVILESLTRRQVTKLEIHNYSYETQVSQFFSTAALREFLVGNEKLKTY
jgi:hypothetical protein